MATYTPKPIETSSLQLTASQRALVEKLAENTHEVWALKRLADGWQFGPQRDDRAKTHPCLVPYADLPDSERAYDRTIVEEVIKAALSLGYLIELAPDTPNV